jgi:pyrroloquinoline quinone (PQQ) biosynthesis protein C
MTTEYLRTLERQSESLAHSLDRHPLVGSVISGDACQQDYARFLIATYHYVRWSGFLLARTAQGLEQSGRSPSLRPALEAKAEEEAPHDRWVLRDLKNLGINPELVKGSAIPTAVRAYVEWSLTLAEAGSPAFLGAAYTLEYISMRRARLSAENLRTRAAIPNVERALRFLDGHGEADDGHIAELETVLRGVEDERDQADITLSAEVMRRLYPVFFALPSSQLSSQALPSQRSNLLPFSIFTCDSPDHGLAAPARS